ncbi:hypothetical protein BDW59DRAFT_174590 [Aspergillus cavernicola]|uniref:Alcohol acetyltransferase n=1 Tax=Aspergillus cavernicola TaxID=176166 RepID=A0ABR4HXP5_9EURO
MASVHELEKLQPLGRLEHVSASCHHLGFFNVGVSAHYKLSESSFPAPFYLRRLIFAAAGDVIRRHRILSAIPVGKDSPDTLFTSLQSVDLDRITTFLKRSHPPGGASGIEDKHLDAVHEEQHNTNFKSEYDTLPFWRLIVLQDIGLESGFTVSFIYHHAIGDGVSGLVFHNAFLDALGVASYKCLFEYSIEGIIEPDENTSLLLPLEQLHPLPTNPVSPSPSATNLKEWTGCPIRTPCKSCWTSLCFSPGTSEAFFQECKEQGAPVTSAVSSILTTALSRILPTTAEALTCIIPVSLHPWLKLPRNVTDSAIGTYINATRVQFTRASSKDIWAGARHASKAINDYLANVSPSGEPYTAVAVFKTISDVSLVFKSLFGKPRDAVFEVTNTGRFSASTTTRTERFFRWQVGKVMFGRSSVVSGAVVTVSVGTGGGGSITVGISWQEGVVEEEIMNKPTESFKKHFDQYQSEPGDATWVCVFFRLGVYI